MYFQQITSGSLEEHIYLLGADGTNDVVVIDPGEAQPALDALAAGREATASRCCSRTGTLTTSAACAR